MNGHRMAAAAVVGALWGTDGGAKWPAVAAGLVVTAPGRRARLLALVTALAVAWRAEASLAALSPPAAGPFDGWVVLADDPRPAGPSGVAVTVRHGGRRLTATAHGPVAGRLDDVLAGEQVRLVGRVRPVAVDDDRARWRHVVGRLTVEAVTDRRPGSPVTGLANSLRRTLAAGAGALDRADRAVFLGMVIGDDREQRPVVADDFRAAGLGHLLVVSGQNVAFVLTVAAPVVARWRPAGRFLGLIAVLGVFAVTTRFEPSVLRAVAMAGVGLAGAVLGRPVDGRRGLSWAVAGLLVVDPFLVHQLAFRLSAAATAGIVWLAAPLAARLPGPAVLTTPVATTMAAQIGVAPLLLAVFGPVPLATLPANLAAGPASGAVMVWGCTAGLVAGVLGGTPAQVLHLPTRLLLWWVTGVASVAARAPAATIGPVATAGLTVSVLALFAPVRALRWPGAAMAAVVATTAVVGAPTPGREIRRIAPGITLAGDPGGAVVVLDDPAPPRRVLESLRLAGARRVALVVALDGDRGDAEAVLALRDRYGAVAVGAPPLHRVPGARTLVAGRVVVVGDVVVEVLADRPRLRVRVARGPPVGSAAMPVATVATHVELGETRFDISTRALVMGILNRTPDSFFDGGRYWAFDEFLAKAEQLVAEGADFLDVGGSKAGPGPEVTVQEEMERVVPAVEALRARFDLPISVDTFRASVLEESLKAGACVGNDISGFADPGYLPVAAAHGASVVATHVRIGPRIPDPQPSYADVRAEVTEFLRVRAESALAAGIPAARVMVDAGLDLGKTAAMSLELLRHSDDLVALGYPVFLSASNKTFLGEVARTDVDDRREVTFGAHALGIALGCRILRAHDVKGNRRLADTMSAVLAHRRS